MDYVLNASKRDTAEKNSLLRKEGWVPGCIYGKSTESLNIKVPYNDLRKCLSGHAAKFELKIEGEDKFLVGVEEVQRGPLQDKLLHISFHVLDMNQVSTLHVPLEFSGKALGQMEGGILKENFHEIVVKGYPADLPDKVVVDVSQLNIGDSIHVSDLVDKFKFEFLAEDHEKVLVSCSHPKVHVVDEPKDEEVQFPEDTVAEAEEGKEEEKAA